MTQLNVFEIAFGCKGGVFKEVLAEIFNPDKIGVFESLIVNVCTSWVGTISLYRGPSAKLSLKTSHLQLCMYVLNNLVTGEGDGNR